MFESWRALLCSAVLCAVTSSASATVFNPATNPILGPGGVLFTWSTVPAVFADSWYSNDSNTDVGPQNAANVETTLETATWVGLPLTFVSGGACTVPANCTTGSPNTGTWTAPVGDAANVFGIHFGNEFIAILYAGAQTSFSILNLPHGVSNILAFCSLTAGCEPPPGGPSEIPIPGAFLLFGSALAGLGLLAMRRRRPATVPRAYDQ